MEIKRILSLFSIVEIMMNISNSSENTGISLLELQKYLPEETGIPSASLTGAILKLEGYRGGHMILTGGNDLFYDNSYSYWNWSAAIYQDPEELEEKIKSLDIIGRSISDIVSVGFCYNYSEDSISDYFNNKSELKDDELIRNTACPRMALIGDPVILFLDDGRTLDIDYTIESSVRAELDSLPVDIKPSCNSKNLDICCLFEPIIGKKISSIEVNSSMKISDIDLLIAPELKRQKEYIKAIKISFEETDNRLEFGAFLDYGTVSLTDRKGNVMMISLEEILEKNSGYITKEGISDYLLD